MVHNIRPRNWIVHSNGWRTEHGLRQAGSPEESSAHRTPIENRKRLKEAASFKFDEPKRAFSSQALVEHQKETGKKKESRSGIKKNNICTRDVVPRA